MKKTTLLILALAAVPALAVASPEIAVHQTAVPPPTITIPARSLLRTRIIVNKFRVEQLLPIQVTLASVGGPPVRVTFQIGIKTALALREGEIVKLKIVPVHQRKSIGGR